MKNCAYCGRENKDDASQCSECGTSEFNFPTPQIPAESLERLDSMTLQMDITPEDRAALVRFLMKKFSIAKWQVGMAWACCVVLGILFAALSKNREQGIWFWIFLAGFSCAILLISINGRILKRKMQSSVDSCIFGLRQISIEDVGCRETSKDFDCLYRWSAIQNIELTDHYIFIMIDRIAGIIVPRKIFSTNTEYLQFINELRIRSAKAK